MPVPALAGHGRLALWAGAAVLALLVGYADLWRGGTSLAALGLALGYAVFIPLALLSVNRHEATPLPPAPTPGTASHFGEPPWLAAGGTALAILILYVITLAPSTAMWDASEYITAARVFGVPHPPGNPVFVIFAHAFGLIPLPIEYAARINLLAAVTSALSAGLWFLVTDGVLRAWISTRWVRLVAAGATALVGATAFTVWNQSVVNEKVYTVALLGLASVSWLMLRWSDFPDRASSSRFLLCAAYLVGLGYANHPAGFLPAPAIGLLLLTRHPLTLIRWRLVVGAVAVLILGLTPFVAMPIRSAHNPGLNSGQVSECTNGINMSCAFSAETLRRTKAHIDREQYSGHNVVERKAPITAQYGMLWLYFKWQWARDAFGQNPGLQQALAFLFLGLGIAGGLTHYQRDRKSFWYVGGLIFTLTIALVVYLNFKYGHSQAPELGRSVDREVRDRDYFYLWTFSTWGLWVGLGITALWGAAARFVARDSAGGAVPARAWAVALPVLLLAAIPLATNAAYAPRNQHTFTREWSRDLLNSVEPYGVLVTSGDNDSFPVWFAQEVLGIRRDVTVVVTPYLGTEWYAEQLMRRPVEDYDAAAGPEMFRSGTWTKPTRPLFSLSAEQLYNVPPAVQLAEPQRFVHEGIDATIPAGFLTRDQQLVLYLIKQVAPERPVYFSIGGYAASIGLGDYVATRGLTQKLMMNPIVPSRDMIPLPGAGSIDVVATQRLWASYGGIDALLSEGGWIDDASGSIPYMYGVTGQFLAAALDARSEEAAADTVMITVTEIAKAARLR